MADKLLRHIFQAAEGPRPPVDFPYYGVKLDQSIKTYFNLPIYDNPIGIEVEAERFGGLHTNLKCWKITDDGSLRNGGVEFVSYPLYRDAIDLALYELQREFSEQEEIEFTHRCSIHVHVNVSEFSRHQLFALIALYAIYEKSLFEFVEQARKGNSFCYPLVGTTTNFSWQYNTKYCAFNWTPIQKQMTVEYRHLEGTKDWQKLRRWVALVSKLTSFVGSIPKESAIKTIKDVLTNDMGIEYARTVFGNTVILLKDLPGSVNHGTMWATSFLERNE